ncbi:MAG: hypothetical protein G3M70_12875 [Candidatus Nitronauta litoralis]|uniref:Uncharacterized protein n=1 Tax=Candidatus Nitronauta litoralis TaxID=2705533 RepID=A0A7T0G0P0_9BACT|nr:MAG: hypothetical protein G3M70_12875 [Candidatus Nitronauta litoralis]
MLSPDQKQIVTLMFLNGILFLSLNVIARSIVFPGPRKSKRMGYILILIAVLSMAFTWEYRLMTGMSFSVTWARNILLGGFAVPVFFISLVYYRIMKNRAESQNRRKPDAID